MASTSDIRDIMDIGPNGQRPLAPKKKKKTFDSQPRLSGISREVQALMGDSVPPVAIVDTPKYKSKPSLATRKMKPRHWENRPFIHGARKDGLVLKHWKRMIPGTGNRPPVTSAITPTDIQMTDAENEGPAVVEIQFEEEFPMDKWNIQIPVPSYTAEQYENYFKSDDWTKEETDHLLELARDFDLRWLLIADRYDPVDVKPASETAERTGDETARTYPERSMEALKSRYYTVAAKTLEQQTPASNMTQTEFQLWEKMRNFDAKTETLRKTMAEKLFERTKDEADEERTLLEELHRITKNEEDFIKMRKDLYSRLESAPSLRRNERGEEQNVALYQTSSGLSMLLQSLLAKEKRFKRPTLPNGETPTSATGTQNNDKGRHPNQYSRRDTMDTQADESGPQKKGSISQPVIRNLSVAEEVKYGVSHPTERLTSGVMFRHEKINRITTAKSQVQTQKINAALTELSIPHRLSMPTERVCREFERLVGEVQLLLDARRNLEKVVSEVKILEEMKRQRLGQPSEGEGENGDNKTAIEVDDASETQQNGSSTMDELCKKAGDTNEAINEDEDDDDAATARNPQRSGVRADNDDDDEEEEDAEIDESAIRPDDQDDEEDDQDESFARRRNDDDEDDEDGVDQDDGEDDEDGEEEEDDDDTGLEGLRRRYNGGGSDDEDDNENGDGEQEDDDDDQEDVDVDIDVSMANGADNEDDEEEEEDEENGSEEEDDQPTVQPIPSGSMTLNRSHKRSASVLSDASMAGSNRSGIERKKRR